MNSKLPWFIGGFLQIEHHLLLLWAKKISKIVQSTAWNLMVPWFSAVHSHYKFLKYLGSYNTA